MIVNEILFFLPNDLSLTLISLLSLKDIIRSVYVKKNKTNSLVLSGRKAGEIKKFFKV